MKVVGIYIQDSETLEYNRVDLFDDEKISVTSSIQNINDISKTYTDFSQTFSVPASKQNNKIFKHWYDNSNDAPFSTLTKSNAYIEIDTIPFRKGKIQLESANLIDGQAQDYSITFVGILGNLKDIFANKYLKDLTSTAYDFVYTPDEVLSKVTGDGASEDVMFPLITSKRLWGYGDGNGATNNIANEDYPIRYNELFPAIRLRAVLNMIETEFGINFDGTLAEPSTFLSDARFTNAYLYLKNREEFIYIPSDELFTFQTTTAGFPPSGAGADFKWQGANTSNGTFTSSSGTSDVVLKEVIVDLYPNISGVPFQINLWSNTTNTIVNSITTTSTSGLQSFSLMNSYLNNYSGETHSIRIVSFFPITFSSSSKIILLTKGFISATQTLTKTSSQTVIPGNLSIKNYMPEIKIEDFFSGLLKMFNLTCYSTDGVNYTIKQLESYYDAGNDIDITKYVLQDKKALNKVKTYKRINFEYEKSESFINVGFNANAGIEYGSLRYVNSPPTEGEEYTVKLPFENLNFSNLNALLQVGYSLKTDYLNYIPKPIILYDYNSANATTAPEFYWSNFLVATGVAFTKYKAFGQETLIGGETYGLNFNEQQSTLTNNIINNGLYQQYYSGYFANIYNYKARLVKVSGILPTSILTTLKLNDSVIIRDSKYLINSYTTDLTTGLVQFELLTDERVRPDKSLVLNLDAGNIASYPGTGTLWTDLSIYGNNGTLVNSPAFDSSNGGSIVFDGVNEYVNCGNASNLQITVGTISVWVKTTTPGSSYRGIITKQYSWGLFVKDNILITYDWGNVIDRTTGINIADGTWKNIVMTFTQTIGTPSNNVIVYLNGNPVLTTTVKYSNNTINVELARGGNNPLGYSQILNGNISQALIGNRVLSATEVLANFNATKGRYGL